MTWRWVAKVPKQKTCVLYKLALVFFPFCSFATEKAFKQFHDATYKVGWDINFSPYAGGEDILFVHRGLERIEGYLVGKSPIYCSQSAAARFWRFSELYFVWMPVNMLAVVTQHEVFGHGYRIRDINHGTKVAGYSIDSPPPYGHGGGATYFNTSYSFTTSQESAVSMAGVESTAILAQLTKFKWLESHRIDPRQTILYLLSQHDLNLYIGTLKIKDEDLRGHDIHMYINSLNYTYTNNFISKGRLRSLSWINLADPFTYYSAYAWFRYIWTGKETRIPTIPIFGMGYLPTLRLGLTPFGPELFIENYLIKGNKPTYFYLVGGSHSQNRYGGFGFYSPRIWTNDHWSLGFRFDAWRQPKLLLEPGSIPFDEINFDQKPDKNNPIYPYSEQHAKQIGAAGSIIIGYQKMCGFETELGYKSQGFLPGYSLKTSPTARLYFTLVF